MPGDLLPNLPPILPSLPPPCSPGAGDICNGKDAEPIHPGAQPKPPAGPQPKEKPRWKKYLHCGAGILGGIAAWEVYYNIDERRGLKGWVEKFSWDNYRNIGFDRNTLFINRGGHAIGGTGYNLSCHILGDLGELESAMGTFFGSAIFELGAEEAHPSANDHPYTTLVGPAIGGTLNLFFRYFPRLKTDFNSSRNFLGIDEDPRHRFDLMLGADWVRSPDGIGAGQNIKGELNAEVTRIAGYGRPGRRRGWIQGNKAELGLALRKDEGGISDIDIRTQAGLIGHHREALREEGPGQIAGYQMYLGAGTVFDYRQHFGRTLSPEDNLGAGSVGIMADLGLLTATGATLRLRADLLGDFAMSTPYAFDKWVGDHSTQDIKPVLEQGYYYGLGRTARARLTADYRDYQLGILAEHQHLDSIEGFSRNQGSVQNDINLVDTRIQRRLWLSKRYGNFKFAGEIGQHTRKGRVENVSREGKTLRAGIKLGITF